MGRPISRAGISHESERALAELIADNVPIEEAARRAGFPDTVRPRHAMAGASFAYELRRAIQRRFAAGMPEIARVIWELAHDKENVPARVRLDAARAWSDRAGFAVTPASKDDEAKSPTEMTQEELVSLIERLEREKSDRAVLVGSNATEVPNVADFLN